MAGQTDEVNRRICKISKQYMQFSIFHVDQIISKEPFKSSFINSNSLTTEDLDLVKTQESKSLENFTARKVHFLSTKTEHV